MAELPPQTCPACGAVIDVPDAEPLSRVACPACGEMVRIERAFDHFIVVEMLGVGGMGSVYKARDTRLDRMVALKVLRKDLSADPAEAARLEQEARVAASINHPNAVQVYSTGTAHGQIYLVMELVDHGSLDDLMAEHARIPEAQVLATAIQIAKGLQAAHAKGLIHRDVKPANILFADGQTAKIGDFGLAVVAEQKAEANHEIWGTPYYVAPERLNNEPEDFRSDIFSLGATLFHALAGRSPIEGETTSASELRELKSHAPDLRAVAPEISSETARIIRQMLAPQPNERFGSYAELIAQLEQAARPADVASAGNGNAKWIWALLALLIVGAAIGGFYFVKKSTPASTIVASPTPTISATPDNSAALRRAAEAREQRRLAAEAEARETARKKLFAEESPAWEKALADARAKIALYDFVAALRSIDGVKVSEPSLVEAQTAERKKMNWLVEWKAKLIADLNAGRFRAPIEISGAKYTGAAGANQNSISFVLPFGQTAIAWTKINAAGLLAIAKSIIPLTGSEAADREWLAAVFAFETGQLEAAHELADAAAKAKPEYREELKTLFPAEKPAVE